MHQLWLGELPRRPRLGGGYPAGPDRRRFRLRLPLVGRAPLQRLFVRTRQHPTDDLSSGAVPPHRRGTAAVILPWHDPLRVAENAAVLDMLSKGRLRLGMGRGLARRERSEEHTSELQSLMRISYAVFCLKKKN